MANILNEMYFDLNNWTKNMTSFPVFQNEFTDGINTLSYQGGGGYERLYIPLDVKKNRDYTFKFKMYSPTGFQMGDYGNDYAFAFVRTSAPSDTDGALNKTNLAHSQRWETAMSDAPVEYSISFNSGNYTTLYVALDFGYILDGVTSQFVFSDFELDNGSEIPTEYVKYVESDGTQYINLNYIHTANTKIELVCRVIKNNQRSWQALFGSRYRSYQNNAFIFFTKFNGNDTPAYNRSGYETLGVDFVYDDDITLVCYQKLATWTTKNGTSYNITAKGTSDVGIAPMFLFDLNNAQSSGQLNPDTSRSVMRVYSLKIYENDTLVRYYRPAIDSNNIGYLFEDIEKEAYYPAEGNQLNYMYNDGYYLVRNGVDIYSIIDDELVLLEESHLSSELFKTHGIQDVPDWAYISHLTNPEILYWQSKLDNVPILTASMTAIPASQTIISNKIDLTHPSITGIESATVTCEGNIVFAVSFDNKATWKSWNGTEWSTVSEDTSGMTKELFESITYNQWLLLFEVASSFYIRASLLDTTAKLTQVYIDFAN